ncbi:MAG: Gfo/Idh/MocA family oxidoreductase [Kiritimatiellae bacterium]|nr:Gfo/Idh/MocA family oxidoreductase [Kiritimatiellia bacterium]
MRSYNVGIVGFGFIGRVHAYGHVNMPLFYDPAPCRTRITHVCTAHPASAEKGRDQLGATHAVTDFRAITENPDIDIVHICTPNNLHKDALLSAMRHNKHIYCDKPLVADMREADEIRAALPAYRGIGQMTLQNRFFPATLRAKQLIDDGFLGQPLEFRACYLHSGSADPDAPLKWKLARESGGGVIADLGSHILDLIHHLLGDYEELLAATRIAYPDRPSADDPATRVKVEAEDCMMVLARMRSGAIGHIEASKIATGTEDDLRFELHGSRGGLRFESMRPHGLEAYDMRAPGKPLGGQRGWTRIDTGQRYPEPAGFPSPKLSIGWIRSHMACLVNFLNAVVAGKPTEPGLEQGIHIQHLMECTRQSAQERAWVRVEGRESKV